jgi:succinate dehydrogenase hydrophobic anchor subunit
MLAFRSSNGAFDANAAPRPTSLFLWGLQRLSAFVLGPLVLAHIVLGPLGHGAIITGLLVLIVVAHSVVGVWRLGSVRGLPPALELTIKATTIGVAGLLVFLSAMIIAARI